MWHGRFREDTAEMVQRFSQSLDLDWRLAPYDVYGSIAHVRMLEHVGLLEQREAAVLEDGLREVLREIQEGSLKPLESMEDVHMNIEARLTELIGPLGAKLHSGRSRNDQSATSVRLYLRKEMYSVGDALITLMDALLDRATALARDFRRVLFALESVNECPLGSGALAGSTLPLDRGFTTVMLGFDRTSDNSLDSVAHRDHLLDCQYAMTVLMVHASRMAEDLVIYNSREFGWIVLPDAFCTGSSMMPQKKNPDVLELVRGRSARVIGNLVDLLTLIKGLPLAYNRDMQEDKRALWSSVQIVRDVLDVLPQLIARVEVDAERAAGAFEDGFTLATDVAEYLVMKGVPFRTAHEQVGEVVRWCLDRKRTLLSLTREEWKELIPSTDDDLMPILNIESSVSRRNTQGGTSFKQVALQIERGLETLEVFRKKLASYPARFAL